MNRQQQLEIQAWIDGELSEHEARAAAERARLDPEARALADNLRHFSRLLRDHQPARPLPESREFYWSGIRRAIEAQTPRENPAPRRGISWLAWLVPAGAVALAAILLPRANFRDDAGTPGPGGTRRTARSTSLTVLPSP